MWCIRGSRSRATSSKPKWDAAAKDAPSPEALALGVSIVRGGYATLDENSWAQINAFTTIIAITGCIHRFALS